MARRESAIAFAIVLAGGTGRRMGGASKPDVVVAGRRMIDHILDELDAQGVPAVVVGPPDLDVPSDVTLVREDPPLGGPAAGIAAGYAAGIDEVHAPGLAVDHSTDEVAGGVADSFTTRSSVAILACDAPFAPRVLPQLAAATSPTSVGAVAITPDGRLQRLLCVVESEALGAAIARLESDGGVRDRSVRALLGGLALTPVDVLEWVMDADTREDVNALEAMSPDAPETSP